MHFIIVHKASLTILTLAMSLFVADVSLFSRTPQQAPVQPSCAEAELRRAEADLRAAAAELHCEILKARREEVEKINTSQKAALVSAGQGLAVERRALATAHGKVASLESSLADSISARNKAAGERDLALLKIKNANGALMCEVFSIGCIRER